MPAVASLHRSAQILLALAMVSLTACGSDSLTGSPTGVNSNVTPVVGGLCDPATTPSACDGQQVLACTPAGTWVIQGTCSIGQKCQASSDGATASCVGGGGDASGDSGSGWDAGSVADAEGTDAIVLDDAVGTDAVQPGTDAGQVVAKCTTYQDVQAIFLNNCNGCHGHQFGTSCAMAANYPLIASRVQSGSMPPGGGLSASDKAVVAAWAADHNVCTPAQCPGADAGSTSDTTIADTVGPGPDVIGPGPDVIGPGPDVIGPGPDTVGPGPDTVGPPPASCGNLKCDAGETAANCPVDCGPVNTCILAKCQQQANSCMNSTNCHQAFACDQTCAPGDTVCEQKCVAGKSNKTKTTLNNLNTCIANGKCLNSGPPAVCGNGTCESGETNATCPADCPPVCGDGVCNGTETSATCPGDCPPPPVCGDGVCNGTETTATCPGDCPAKTCTTYTDVQAIFQNNCNGCHGHAFGNGCSSASNYTSINAYVQSGSMPQGSSLSAADKAKIAAWAAAKNACTTATCP